MQTDGLHHAGECPFCGGSHVYVAHYQGRVGTQWRATCGHCNAQTGFAGSPDAAIDAWNRRTEQGYAESYMQAINSEILWCEKYPDPAFHAEYRKGFINGLIQAKYLIQKVREASELW